MSFERILQKATDTEIMEMWCKFMSMDFMNDKANFPLTESIVLCFESEVKKRRNA